MGLKAPFGLLKEHTDTHTHTREDAFTMDLLSRCKKPRADTELGAPLLPAELLAIGPRHPMCGLQSPPLAFLKACQAPWSH